MIASYADEHPEDFPYEKLKPGEDPFADRPKFTRQPHDPRKLDHGQEIEPLYGTPGKYGAIAEPGYHWAHSPSTVHQEFATRAASGTDPHEIYGQLIAEINDRKVAGEINNRDAHRAANEAFGHLLTARTRKAKSSYGEMAPDSGSREVRSLRSGSNPRGFGKNSVPVVRGKRQERISEGLVRESTTKSNSPESSHTRGEDVARRSQGATGSSSQRKQARQSPGESDLRNTVGPRERQGSARYASERQQDALSEGAFVGGAEPAPRSASFGIPVMQGLQESLELYPESSGKRLAGRSRSEVSADHGSIKTAWSGWGPDQKKSKKRKVAGWEWDNHLNAYISNSPREFQCSCGNPVKVPDYYRCSTPKCGKVINTYIIGTGGDKHQAAAEKFIAREVVERDHMMVAKKVAYDDYDHALGDWEHESESMNAWPSDHHPKVDTSTKGSDADDWYSRDHATQRWVKR